MNTITIDMQIDEEKLRNTLYKTIKVEMKATETERGRAEVEMVENMLNIKIYADDYVAARALTNSILRLVKASVDVVDSITISKNQ